MRYGSEFSQALRLLPRYGRLAGREVHRIVVGAHNDLATMVLDIRAGKVVRPATLLP